MKTAVVFYSLDGNTKFIAEKIAAKLEADIIELKPVKPFPTGKVSKFLIGGKSAMFKEKPQLEQYDFNSEDYDTVVIGTPMWAGTITPPIRTFLTDNDLSDKRVAAYVCCGGSKADKILKVIAELAGQEKLAVRMAMVEPLKNQENVDARVDKFCGRVKG